MLLPFLTVLVPLSIIGLLLRRWRMLYRKQLRVRQLRTWAAESTLLDPVSKQWIRALPRPQLEVLLDLVQGYCVSLKWELDWLFAPQLQQAPALYSALEESIVAYIHAILLSLQMVDDVQAYRLYLTFDKRPHARRQRALVQELYAKIHHQRPVPKVQGVFSRFSRSPSTHQAQINAIRQAFAQEPARTMAAFKEVVVAKKTV